VGARVELAEGSRVLIVRLSAMGDVVQGLGAVRALAEARPDLELCWVLQRPFVPLLRDLPGVTPIAHDRGGGARGFARTGRHLRQRGFDLAVDLQGNWKSAGLARLSGAGQRLGVAGPARREPASAVLLNRFLRLPAELRHPGRQALQLVRALAPTARDLPPWLGAAADECAREAAALRELGLDPGRPFRVFVLGRQDDPRSIRAAALARAAAASVWPCLAVAGPGEAEVAAPPRVARLEHGPGEVRRLVALGALCARAGGDVLGPDKGATQVLAATGVRTVCVFGPTDPERSGPPAARALRVAVPPPCAPCHRRTCGHAEGPVCTEVG
jgi:ADP-heptose:LPS heptosyltransferase